MVNKYVELINTNVQVQIRLIVSIVLLAGIAIGGQIVLKQNSDLTQLKNRKKAILATKAKHTSSAQHIPGALVLEGIFDEPGKNSTVALINGNICTVGSMIENFSVTAISKREVSLINPTTQETKTLTMPEIK